jgi:hypothetical protein
MTIQLLALATLLLAPVDVEQDWLPGQRCIFAVKPDGTLINIDGRLYCWPTHAKKPRWWNQKLPSLPDAANARWIEYVCSLQPPVAADKAASPGCYLTSDDPRAKQRRVYLAADEQGRAVLLERPDARSFWRVRDNGTWPEGRDDPADVIHVYKFRCIAGPDGKGFLGMVETPLVLKDKEGNEQEFYPLTLTDEDHAAEFVYNDYSGK